MSWANHPVESQVLESQVLESRGPVARAVQAARVVQVTRVQGGIQRMGLIAVVCVCLVTKRMVYITIVLAVTIQSIKVVPVTRKGKNNKIRTGKFKSWISLLPTLRLTLKFYLKVEIVTNNKIVEITSHTTIGVSGITGKWLKKNKIIILQTMVT